MPMPMLWTLSSISGKWNHFEIKEPIIPKIIVANTVEPHILHNFIKDKTVK